MFVCFIVPQFGLKTFVQLKFRNFLDNPEMANFSSQTQCVSEVATPTWRALAQKKQVVWS